MIAASTDENSAITIEDAFKMDFCLSKCSSGKCFLIFKPGLLGVDALNDRNLTQTFHLNNKEGTMYQEH